MPAVELIGALAALILTLFAEPAPWRFYCGFVDPSYPSSHGWISLFIFLSFQKAAVLPGRTVDISLRGFLVLSLSYLGSVSRIKK